MEINSTVIMGRPQPAGGSIGETPKRAGNFSVMT